MKDKVEKAGGLNIYRTLPTASPPDKQTDSMSVLTGDGATTFPELVCNTNRRNT